MLTFFKIFKQSNNESSQKLALKIFKNILNNKKVLQKLSKHLSKILEIFIDKSSSNREEILSVLTEFASIDDNRKILIENGATKEILEMLKNGSLSACDAICVMSLNLKFLGEILQEKIYEILHENFMNENFEIREKFLKTFHGLITVQGLSQLIEISPKLSENFSKMFKISQPFKILQILISILEKFSHYLDVKEKISTNELAHAVYTSLALSTRQSILIIRLLNLITNYLDQPSFRDVFIKFPACEFLSKFLKSSVHQIRVSSCNLINVAANYEQLSTTMINEGILRILLDCFECTICSDGFETMLNSDLSLKFAIRRRLEVNDKIKSGFYASKGEIEFMDLKKIMSGNLASPLSVVYTVNFRDEIKVGEFDKN